MISSSYIYWLSVVDGIKVTSAIGIIVFIVCFGIVLGTIFDGCLDEDEEKSCKKWAKVFFALIVLCVLVLVFVPSKETLLTMKFFELATKENIDWTVEQAKAIVDYLVESISKIVG